MSTSPLTIIAHARAGALDHALRLFKDAGLETVTDDPAVLSLKGRLLKDQGRLAKGEARRAFYARSAAAYDAAGAISWATYPLINAASLSLLAGESERAKALAEKVLSRLDRGDHEPDTPYWREATRAEAELVLGRSHAARRSLATAIELAPRAWEDQASTLRQFALILEAQEESADWLEPLRPPRALHFAGHMGVDPDDGAISEKIARLLGAERIGFGYGALAAGADIVFAEALLARGAELHLVLPTGREVFRTLSVASLGKDWTGRFDALMDQAESVTAVGPTGALPTPLTLMLATRAAMGRAAMQARLLATEAVQALVQDPADAGRGPSEWGGTNWAATIWTGAGRRSLAVAAPRVRTIPTSSALHPVAAGERFAAVLALAPGEADQDLAHRLPDLWRALRAADAAPETAPVWTGANLLLLFNDCDQALIAARIVAPLLGMGQIAGAAGVVTTVSLGEQSSIVIGSPVDEARRLLASVPPGAALVTAAFAAILCSVLDDGACSSEPVGELPASEASELGDDRDRSVFSLRL